jgi:hypothetical protein
MNGFFGWFLVGLPVGALLVAVFLGAALWVVVIRDRRMVDALIGRLTTTTDALEHALAEIGALRSDTETLYDHLRKYGRHLDECGGQVPCVCGFQEALDRYPKEWWWRATRARWMTMDEWRDYMTAREKAE